MTIRFPLIAASAALIAVGACAPQTGTQTGGIGQLNRTQQGAIAGAVVGGLYGLQRDDDGSGKGRDVAKGALVGAAAGAIAGNILDRQQAALQQSLTTPGIQIINNGDHLKVVMPNSILFASDSAAVSGVAQNDLYALAQNLNDYPNSRVEVIGHTDNTGTADYNLDLSQRRAQSVAGILSAAGVSSARLATIGRGEDQPAATNQTEAGKAANRRVEILIRPTS